MTEARRQKSESRSQKNISVVIPALNEENNIRACIESAKRLNPVEIIVVDGGSTDRTKEVAKAAGAQVVDSPKGRGVQMNMGASHANGDLLLFLHADSRFHESLMPWQIFTQEFLQDYSGGFFKLAFDDNSISTRLVELFANFRARFFSLPYGDQAVFIRRDIFQKLGGFREYPFLEDIDMSIRIRKFGRLKYIPLPVTASSRRIQKGIPLSPVAVSIRNVVIALLFMAGISPFALMKFYR
ncbi:MAG: TIGR04283 family arsenosugar biosynthesis glycosyltransferase [Thermodesulfovibrionales bacterium]|nr:TIGR04283 family arsenosugar biosynthesis glycosyltransferase [Thermodesulfovibrionales bacterium]